MRPKHLRAAEAAAITGALSRELSALGVTVDIATAAEILGVSRAAAYDAIRRDGALCGVPVLCVGKRMFLPTAPLLRALGIEAPEQEEVG